MKRILGATSILTILAACGGGDGDSIRSFTSFTETSANDTVRLSGMTRTASFTSDSTGDADVGTITATDDASATVRFRNDLLSRLAIRGSGADITLDDDSGAQFAQLGALVLGATADGNEVVALVDPSVTGFNYQTFGYWSKGISSGGVGVGSFGARTGDQNMPGVSPTTASYTGTSAGLLDSSGVDYSTESDITVTTDFELASVLSNNTALYDMNDGSFVGTAGELDFVATGAITGDSFTAVIDEIGAIGELDGQFYGPNAEEVGGTFQALTALGAYAGAFGAD